MGNFSLDKYQEMKPLYVQALDISKTVDILSEAEKQNNLMSNLKLTDAVVGTDTQGRDVIHSEASKQVDAAADSSLNPLDKQKYVQRAAVSYVNNPILEAYGKSVAQQKEYNEDQFKRVGKGDIKDEDAAIATQASLLAHNLKGGTNPATGNYFVNSTYQVPNVVDEQGIVKDIVATPDGYRTENQTVVKYNPATGEIFTKSIVDGKEYFQQGKEVGQYLYDNNEKGIKDRHLWDAKKEVARQLVIDGKYSNASEAFITVDQNRNGDFTNRLNERVLEKKTRFINSLVAQKDFMQTEYANKQSINPAAVGSGAEDEPTDLVIDTRGDVHPISISDEELDNLDLDKFLDENKATGNKLKDVTTALKISPMLGGGYSYVSGSQAEKDKKAQTDYKELMKTIQDLKSGNAEVLKKYGYDADTWKNMSKQDQYTEIKNLIKQRKNTTSSVGILEANNENVYKESLQNANEILIYDHNKNTYQKLTRNEVNSKYLNNGGWFSSSLSQQDAKTLKQNSNFKSDNTSSGIDSYEELANHLSSSKTPELTFDFTGYKVKPYLQYNFGDNNSAIRVPVSDITESSLVPIQEAFKEFKNPTGSSVKIANSIVLSAGGQNKTYTDLNAKWVNGTFTIFSGNQPTTLTLDKLAVGMVGRQINNLNTTKNVAKTKQNKPETGK